jgi:hypothetical protein
VYPPGAQAGTFPEAIVVEVPQYCGPESLSWRADMGTLAAIFVV